MSGKPDPKPERKRGNKPRRVISPKEVRAGLLAHPWCAACGARAANGHHVLERSLGGDDVPGNIVGLCGSGTARCHGSLHGSPYVVTVNPAEPVEERRDKAWVSARIRGTIERDRPDVLRYLIEKLGAEPAAAFLDRVYPDARPVLCSE